MRNTEKSDKPLNKTTKPKPSITFNDCENYGDMIKALVSHFSGNDISDFVTSRASEEIKINNKKIEEFTNKLTA